MRKNVLTTLVLAAGIGAVALTSCAPQASSATAIKPSDACLKEPEVQKTSAGVSFVRTPDACFANLPDWNYEPKYLEIDGLRQAYVDVGPRDADPILLLHGQPSWSYLYRYMIPELAKGGHRVIAMDHLGMGRSDKPIDLKYHSYANHFNRLDTFIQTLELKRLTVFVQDWGSVLGLDLASRKPATFDRIILGNGGFPNIDKPYALPKDVNAAVAQFGQTIRMIPPQQPPFFDAQGRPTIPVTSAEGGNPFGDWIAYAMNAEDFRPSAFIEALTYHPLTSEQRAAYDAPFPDRIMMAAPRTFPSLVNQTVGRYQSVMDGLKQYKKPFLTIFGSNEPGLSPAGQQWFIDNVPGAAKQDHYRFPDASHFLQDDKGKEIAERVNKFMAVTP